MVRSGQTSDGPRRGVAHDPGDKWRLDRKALAYAMRRAGIATPAQLSVASGVSDAVCRNLIVGHTDHPSAATLCSLAMALGCDALDLMVEVGR